MDNKRSVKTNPQAPAAGAFFRLALLAVALCSGTAWAAKWDSPNKTDDSDHVLTLKVGSADAFKLVMRRLDVPGKEFWLDKERDLLFGEGGKAGPYERPVSVTINGATFTDQTAWHIWLGKYETTVGQYAYVMGDGDIAAGLRIYTTNSMRDNKYLDPLLGDEKKRLLAMAKPADRLAPAHVQLFVRKLNQLCHADPDCREALPNVGADSTVRGEKFLSFFRLPTELEWEYAARGVSVERREYRNSLPVSASKIGSHAQLKKLASIGRKKPIFGFYDIFGNVAEIVSGRMSPAIGASGAGAWLAKGGKALGTVSKKPYSSQREEILEFEWRAEDDAPRSGVFNKVGFRLAIGAPFLAFDNMATNERPPSASTDPDPAPTTPAATGSGLAPADDIAGIASALAGSDPNTAELKRQLENALERLRTEDLKRNTRMARFVADNTFVKIVRIWSLGKSNESLKKRLTTIKPDTDKKRNKLEIWKKQLDSNTVQIKRLMQEYEEGLAAIADIPNIDASITSTIDLEGYQQSDDQAVIAQSAIKVLNNHIQRKKSRSTINVRRELDQKYPF